MKFMNVFLPEDISQYLKDSIIVKLHDLHEDGKPPVTIHSIIEMYRSLICNDGNFTEDKTLDELDIFSAVQDLLNSDLVNTIDDKYADSFFQIDDLGLRYVHAERVRGNTIVAKYEALGDNWLTSVFRNAHLRAHANISVHSSNEHIEALGVEKADTWEPLPIDRSQPEYKSAVESLDRAVESIESDNGYAANHPEERDHVVWSLRQGLTAIKEKCPSASQIRSLILEPLQKVILTLKDSATGLAGLAAQEAVKEFVKSLFR